MAQEEDKYKLQEQFTTAVKVIQSLPEEGSFQPSDNMMLAFHSYYMQAILGPCNIARPTGFWDTRGKAEWDAWSSLGDMTKDEAMMNYVENIQLILETIPVSDEVSNLVQKLGNFYSEVEGDEVEENDLKMRPFTRPFAEKNDVVVKPFEKPLMEGYGDLWNDIQNLHDKEKKVNVRTPSVSSDEEEECIENSEMERKDNSSDWEKNDEEENIDKEESTEAETFREWSPDPKLPTRKDQGWTSDTRDSISSIELSMSSVTNEMHSSLNTEIEEEELACSEEPSVQIESYIDFNGELSDHSDALSETNCQATDTDNEEFCDSVEHLAMEEGLAASNFLLSESRPASLKDNDLWFESKTTWNDWEDQVLSEEFRLKRGISSIYNSSSPRREFQSSCGSQLSVTADAVCSSVSHSTPCVSAAGGCVNQQIAVALLRLQHDMANVLHRLHMLEMISLSQPRSPSPKQEESLTVAQKFLRPSWWPFHFSTLTVVSTVLWPMIVHWLVQFYLQRKRRKIT
ncbi:acyl-CoA-binding domain-containing protein 5-like isoform X2 [Thalassophryne amazonica]|uniref:acyl-CoA-binding domain-containing protein 5-like isoform X2 n=1 Tax=Thalassophryne amazonica TaxID=390379 RepID=UPI001470E844|nr:acyl-CoA-binding domain-containing protein 5-like isoform X2 [Thalassophryne amazonica]